LGQTEEYSVLSIEFVFIVIIIIRIILGISPWIITIIVQWSTTRNDGFVIWFRIFIVRRICGSSA
jgi:hypothetical protein